MAGAVAALPPLQAASADPACCPATAACVAESGAAAADVSAAYSLPTSPPL